MNKQPPRPSEHTEPGVETQYAVGDIYSDAPGTGARACGGKPDYSYLPLDIVHSLLADKNLLGRGMDLRERYGEDGSVSDQVANFMGEIGEFHAGRSTGYCVLREAILLVAVECQCEDVWEALQLIVRCFTYGAGKYKRNNWYKGMPWSVPTACAVRHCRDILRAETLDAESGLPHSTHVGCNAFMLAFFEENYAEGDDRPARYYRPEVGDGLDADTLRALSDHCTDQSITIPAQKEFHRVTVDVKPGKITMIPEGAKPCHGCLNGGWYVE